MYVYPLLQHLFWPLAADSTDVAKLSTEIYRSIAGRTLPLNCFGGAFVGSNATPDFCVKRQKRKKKNFRVLLFGLCVSSDIAKGWDLSKETKSSVYKHFSAHLMPPWDQESVELRFCQVYLFKAFSPRAEKCFCWSLHCAACPQCNSPRMASGAEHTAVSMSLPQHFCPCSKLQNGTAN